jgi:serine/threonine protein kinase
VVHPGPAPSSPDDELRARLERAVQARYDVLECLGSGGGGVVYRAFDRQVGAQVAIKILRSLDAEALYRFKHEFRQIARIAHPSLVKLYELTFDEGLWFLTMEYVPGTDVKTAVRGERLAAPAPPESDETAPLRVTTTSQVDERKLRAYLDQLVEGVRALHESGYLHLDIKPSNVRVTPEGRVAILDFGIAQPLGDVRAQREIIGTLRYMAPERFEPGGAVPASDWYSVGCLLFECLVGYLPFAGANESRRRRSSTCVLVDMTGAVASSCSGSARRGRSPPRTALLMSVPGTYSMVRNQSPSSWVSS